MKTGCVLCLFLLIKFYRLQSVKTQAPPSNSTVHDVFYIFNDDGIAIFDPKTNQKIKRIPRTAKPPGTDKTICTPDPFGTPCKFGRAIYVNDRYVFASDVYGDNVIVVDVYKQVAVKAIKACRRPYLLEYVAETDEVWVFCWWGEHAINVIGVRSSTLGTISNTMNASSLVLKHSIKIKVVGRTSTDSGYFRTGNCQNRGRRNPFTVAFYQGESGIHVIDIVKKNDIGFVDLKAYGCNSVQDVEYSSVKRYAFVECSSSLSFLIVVDVAKLRVAYWKNGIVANVIGSSVASPDGKYVMVYDTRNRNIPTVIYYLESAAKPMVRLKDIQMGGFMIQNVVFIRKNGGYIAYLSPSSRSSAKDIMLISLQKTTVTLIGFIRNIPTFKDLTFGITLKTGCGFDDRYIAANTATKNDFVVIDTKKNITDTVYTIVKGYNRLKNIVFVGKYSPRHHFLASKASGMLYNAKLFIILQTLFAIFIAS